MTRPLRAPAEPDLTRIASALADPRRATMVHCLLDGRAWTASELAAAAGVSRPTATEHLHRLTASGLVTEVRQGRHRYLRLADDETAELVERLGALAARHGEVVPAASSYVAQRADTRLRAARTCYQHLAGELGVALADGLRRAGHVTADWELSGAGRAFLGELGVSLPRASGRPLVRPCLDWTERREHLAGAAADALLAHLLDRGHLVRGPVPRSVVLTPAGARALAPVLPEWADAASRPA